MDIATSTNEITLGLSQLHATFVKDEQRKVRYQVVQFDKLSTTAKILTSDYSRYAQRYEVTSRKTNRKELKLESLRLASEEAERSLHVFKRSIDDNSTWGFVTGLDNLIREFSSLFNSIKNSDDADFAVVLLQGDTTHHKSAVSLAIRTVRDWELKRD